MLQAELQHHSSTKKLSYFKKVGTISIQQTLVERERDNLKTEIENLKEDFIRANSVEEELRREIDAQRED